MSVAQMWTGILLFCIGFWSAVIVGAWRLHQMIPNIFDGVFYLIVLTLILLCVRAKFRRK